MGAFSGDGAGCTTRMLKRYGATILGGIHIHMPDSVCEMCIRDSQCTCMTDNVAAAKEGARKMSEAIEEKGRCV